MFIDVCAEKAEMNDKQEALWEYKSPPRQLILGSDRIEFCIC